MFNKKILAGLLVAMVLPFQTHAMTELPGQTVHTFDESSVQGEVGQNQAIKEVLTQLDGFAAQFTQTVVDADDNQIHSAKGSLTFKQPGKFIWQVDEPEEELLVSDGQSVWWFNPFVEQVSIYEANHAVTTTPFALLVNDDPAVWNNFAIQTNKQGFVITPLNLNDAQVIRLEIILKGDGTKSIDKLLITSRSRQVSEYQLFDHKKVSPSDDDFVFNIPAGVDVDDQRPVNVQTNANGNIQY